MAFWSGGCSLVFLCGAPPPRGATECAWGGRGGGCGGGALAGWRGATSDVPASPAGALSLRPCLRRRAARLRRAAPRRRVHAQQAGLPPPPRLVVAQRRAWGDGDGPTPPQRRAPDRRGARRGQHRHETAGCRARGRSRARDSSAPKTGRCTRLLHLTANAGGQGSGRALRRGVRQCRQSVRCQRTVQPSRGSRMPDGVLATV